MRTKCPQEISRHSPAGYPAELARSLTAQTAVAAVVVVIVPEGDVAVVVDRKTGRLVAFCRRIRFR